MSGAINPNMGGSIRAVSDTAGPPVHRSSNGPIVKTVEAMLRKGDRVMVEGRIATRGFTDKEGNDRAVTEIVDSRRQDTVNILGGRRALSGGEAGCR